MSNLLEDFVAQLNANIFYREFSFSKNTFVPNHAESEREFADHVIWLDDLLIIYQLKQRDIVSSSEESERKWFANKVIRKATRQIRSTLEYFQKYDQIEIQNQRGHIRNIGGQVPKTIKKLIIYAPSEILPVDCVNTHFHPSKEAGFIHIMPWHDYLGLCRVLLTPTELIDYFDFRETIINLWGQFSTEKALVGQFLSGEHLSLPSEEYEGFLHSLRLDDFDISFLLSEIGDKIEAYIWGNNDTFDYYKILAEFAKLRRLDLKEIKKRMVLCLDSVNADRFSPPTRIISTTGCGFMFIGLDKEFLQHRFLGLRNLTIAAKYDLRVPRQVGVSFAKDGEDVLIDWCFLDFPWRFDLAIEGRLRENNPFSPMTRYMRNNYPFE
jgi:hypothetical protein